MSFYVVGFAKGLLDFTFFWLCAYLASLNYKPKEAFWHWVFFVGFVALALLFCLAWLVDLGAHI